MQSRAEQSRAEQSRAEQSRAEQSRAEQSIHILFWGKVRTAANYDLFHRLDYSTLSSVASSYDFKCWNVGNNVWQQGIVSALSTKENVLFFCENDVSWGEINERYDKIVYSTANLFAPYHKDSIKNLSRQFRNSRIPIYVVSIGAQASSYDGLRELSCILKDEITEFVDSIYNTGGEIACRGYFTKELLDSICTNSAVVTGCPSLFQNGRNLKIEKTGECVHPVFNGRLFLKKSLLDSYPDSVYIDQDEWRSFSYDLEFYKRNTDKQCLRKLIAEKGVENTRYFLEDRIKLFCDVPEWHRFLVESGFNFSIGSRIHGNIMSLLSGIPAMICAIDSRTREMAEFYNIPYYFPGDVPISVQEIYNKIDYVVFNKNFAKLFDAYEQFLQRCGLVKHVNQNNIFWESEKPLNGEQFQEFKRKLLKSLPRNGTWGEFYFLIPVYAKAIKENPLLSLKKILRKILGDRLYNAIKKCYRQAVSIDCAK